MTLLRKTLINRQKQVLRMEKGHFFSEEIPRYRYYLRMRNYSERTLDSYEEILERFARYVWLRRHRPDRISYQWKDLGSARLDTDVMVPDHWITDFLAFLTSLRTYNPRTLHRIISTLSSFYKYLKRQKIVESPPAVRIGVVLLKPSIWGPGGAPGLPDPTPIMYSNIQFMKGDLREIREREIRKQGVWFQDSALFFGNSHFRPARPVTGGMPPLWWCGTRKNHRHEPDQGLPESHFTSCLAKTSLHEGRWGAPPPRQARWLEGIISCRDGFPEVIPRISLWGKPGYGTGSVITAPIRPRSLFRQA